jgi:hypothetical protein
MRLLYLNLVSYWEWGIGNGELGIGNGGDEGAGEEELLINAQ